MEGQEQLKFLVTIHLIKFVKNMNKLGFIDEDNDLEIEPQIAYRSEKYLQNDGKID